MARLHSCGEYPFLSNATVQKFAGKATARMGETKLRKLLETRLQALGYASMASLPATELQDLTQLGSGTVLMAEAVGLTRGEAIRAINQPNVHRIAKQLVAKGFNPEFPLTVGVLPMKNSSEKEVRVVENMFSGHSDLRASRSNKSKQAPRLATAINTWHRVHCYIVSFGCSSIF